MPANPSMHRAEIDGLRAIAVLAVVLYHFGVPGVGGGFVGVDIFFVISGFLIGGILWRELTARGTVSLSNFYLRRIRRLAPAFVVMALITAVVAYLILLPFEFREFGKTLIASTAYLSNVYFYRQTGYFDVGAEDKVLLHTWSLSVEEQFYIFLPLLLLMFARQRTALILILAGLVVASLALCIVQTYTAHTAAFFLFPHRAWELLAGVLLAIYGIERSTTAARTAMPSWIGLAMVAAAIVFVKPGPYFPGFQAILPVLGTVLLIHNGQHDNAVNRLLSNPAAVFIGLISYSLYLWHWPILVLGRYYLGTVDPVSSAGLMALSLVAAWASWRFVELPTRYATSVAKPVWFAGAAAASAGLLVAGAGIYLSNGLPSRFDAVVRTHIDASQDFLQDWSRCRTPKDGPFAGIEICPVGAADAEPTFLVWGDSHVRSFKEGIDKIATEKGAAGWTIWRAGCPPLFDIEKTENTATRDYNRECATVNARLKAALQKFPASIRSVLLVGRWSYYASGRGSGSDASNTVVLAAAAKSDVTEGTQSVLFAHAVRETVETLAGRFDRIFVLRQPPEIQHYGSRDVAKQIAYGRLASEAAQRDAISVSLSDAITRSSDGERPFQELMRNGSITWLDTWGGFCSDGRCGAVHEGRSNYFDNNHITNAAAIRIRGVFEDLFSNDAPK